MYNSKPHHVKIREAVQALGSATASEIMNWIREKYPDEELNKSSYRADVIGCSKNHTSTHHYPGIPKFLIFDSVTKKYRIDEESPITDLPQQSPLRNRSTVFPLDIIQENNILFVKVSSHLLSIMPNQIATHLNLENGMHVAFILNPDNSVTLKKAKLKFDF
jgi:hypothetical protein